MRQYTESEWSEIIREEQQFDDYLDEGFEDEYERDDYQLGDWAKAYEKWRIK